MNLNWREDRITILLVAGTLVVSLLLVLATSGEEDPGPWSYAKRYAARCRESCQSFGMEAFEVELNAASAGDRCHCRAPGATP